MVRRRDIGQRAFCVCRHRSRNPLPESFELSGLVSGYYIQWKTVPYIGDEVGTRQQKPIPVHQHPTLMKPRFEPNLRPRATYDIDLPSLRKDYLPHRTTRCAQSQQSPRSLPEQLRGGLEPHVFNSTQVSMIRLCPWVDGKIKKDLLEDLIW